MLLKVTEGTKKINIHFCDFCKTSFPEKSLTRTGNIRYSPDHSKTGAEMICNKCRDQLSRIG